MGSNVLCRYEIKGDLDAVNPFASGWGGRRRVRIDEQ